MPSLELNLPDHAGVRSAVIGPGPGSSADHGWARHALKSRLRRNQMLLHRGMVSRLEPEQGCNLFPIVAAQEVSIARLLFTRLIEGEIPLPE